MAAIAIRKRTFTAYIPYNNIMNEQSGGESAGY